LVESERERERMSLDALSIDIPCFCLVQF